MKIVAEEELFNINGGGSVNFTSAVISAIVSGAKIVLEMGRSLGSAIRRSVDGDKCSC